MKISLKALAITAIIAIATSAQQTNIERVFVEAGSFTMGGVDFGYAGNPSTQEVILTDDFYMSKYQITNAQFAEFLNDVGVAQNGQIDARRWDGTATQQIILENANMGVVWESTGWRAATGFENHPIIRVNWFGAKAFAVWAGGDLPTEAQWEFAARGGNQSQGFIYSGSNTLDDIAWYIGPGGGTRPVGQFAPNELGIHDMSGNVWEWTNDRQGNYSTTPQINPAGPANGSYRVIRGGGWFRESEEFFRVATRYFIDQLSRLNGVGFRVVFMPCTHIFDDWETTSHATCIAVGEEKRTCQSCGETETRTIPQLTDCGDVDCEICNPIIYDCDLCEDVGCEICEPCAHGNHDESGAAATCTTPKICNRDGCNHILINALGHILNDLDNWTIAKHATCIEAGSRERIRNCTRANCNHNEKQTAVLSVDPTAHDWSEEITIPATCDETGSIKKICNRAACDESVILQILTKLENCDGTSIVNIQKSDNSHGIRFAVNPVSDNAEISVILSNNEIARETKIAIYDMTGNVVVSTTSTGSVTTATGGAFVWDLRNSAGRFVANGTYLVIAEVKSTSGKIYRYSARLGVKR